MSPGELSLRDTYARVWRNLPSDVGVVRSMIDSSYVAEKGFNPANLVLNFDGFCNQNVLDFGCGLGRNSCLFRHATSLIGYDDEKMIELLSDRDRQCYAFLYKFDNWLLLKSDHYFNTIFASLVFQHMSERVLRAYLEDMTQMCEKLHILSRWYIDENHKPIWPILKDYFNCKDLYLHPDENVLYQKPAPENQLHFEAVMTPIYYDTTSY